MYRVALASLFVFAQNIDLTPLPHADTSSAQVTNVLNVAFGIVGSIALLLVTIAGFRFVLSRGNPQKTEQARNTIIYASVGLVITLSAAAIVNFVVGNL